MTSDSSQATAPTSAYAQRHFVGGVAERYDATYASSGYDHVVWQWQQPWVRRVIRSVRPVSGRVKYLDFACGTGRIISAVEDLVSDATGLDISPLMLDRAAERVRSRLVCGDVLTEPAVTDSDFDVITAFRFFLNTEPAMRAAVMGDLAKRLRDDRARLIFNIHGSRRSVLAVTSWYRQVRGWAPLGLMSPRAARDLIAASGLEVVNIYAWGLLPRRLYRSPVGRMLAVIDGWASRLPILKLLGQDVIYVCRRPGPSVVPP